MRGLPLGFTKHHARHAQVLGQVNVALEAPQQVLAAPGQALDTTAAQRCRELLGRERARPARVEDLQPLQRGALDERGELTSYRLDLGKLGHHALAYEGLSGELMRVATGEPAQRGGADVGERPVVTGARSPLAGATAAQHLPGAGEQRSVLARVVALRVRRIHAVIGRHDEQIVGAQARQAPPEVLSISLRA